MKPRLAFYLMVPLAFGLAALLHWRGSHAVTTAAQSPLVASAAPVRARDGWLATPAAMPHAVARRVAESLAEAVARLTATQRPSDDYDAYNLVQACMDFQLHGQLAVPGGEYGIREANAEEINAETAFCAGMTERMKTQRMVYLDRAAKAGVPGADTAFMRAGPFGDPSALKTRPDDALVVEWKRQAYAQVQAQAEAGNEGSIMTLTSEQLTHPEIWGENLARKVLYMTAMQDIFRRKIGTNTEVLNPFSDDLLRILGKGLTDEQFAAAQASGRAMAARAAERNKSAVQP